MRVEPDYVIELPEGKLWPSIPAAAVGLHGVGEADRMGDLMSEKPYTCRGILGTHATKLTWYVFEGNPDKPTMVLHGYTRKSGRKFGVCADLGDFDTLEARALAFLEDQDELVMR